MRLAQRTKGQPHNLICLFLFIYNSANVSLPQNCEFKLNIVVKQGIAFEIYLLKSLESWIKSASYICGKDLCFWNLNCDEFYMYLHKRFIFVQEICVFGIRNVMTFIFAQKIYICARGLCFCNLKCDDFHICTKDLYLCKRFVFSEFEMWRLA